MDTRYETLTGHIIHWRARRQQHSEFSAPRLAAKGTRHAWSVRSSGAATCGDTTTKRPRDSPTDPWRAAPHAARRWSWDVLAYPDLRLYLAGNTVSNLGTWIQ